jgi:hypothetical protein
VPKREDARATLLTPADFVAVIIMTITARSWSCAAG